MLLNLLGVLALKIAWQETMPSPVNKHLEK